MCDLIRSIQARDPAQPTFAEVLFGYNGFHAVCLHRMNHWLWGLGLKALARALANISRILTGIEIHPAAIIGKRLFIDHGTGVVIGQTSIVHDDVTMYHGVTLGGVGKGRKTGGRRHPEIMDGVMIGAGAQVLGGIIVGKGAHIGANAVVLKDVPEGCTVVGNPARPVSCKGNADFAYGLTRELIDPLAETLERLEKEVAVLKKKKAPVSKKSSRE
ncbi:MAG: serine O-acetyltransferase [Alphaproteobacteria bacterium]|nr:serine O-acetyltransferase [Alphaproteobacteria bacterium]